MARSFVRSMGSAVAMAAALWAGSAHAEVDPCAQALDAARQLRNAGHIHEALHTLGDCSICATSIEVCDATKISLRSAMPTLVVEIHDPEHRERADAKLFIDNALARQDMPVELDPGTHNVRVEGIGRTISERSMNLDEHDKFRMEVVLALAPAPAPAMVPRSITSRPVPPSVWAFGGSGLAALAVSGILWAVAWHEQSDATNVFYESQYNAAYRYREWNTKIGDVHSLMLVSDAAFVVGVAALVSAAVLYLVRPSRATTIGATPTSFRF